MGIDNLKENLAREKSLIKEAVDYLSKIELIENSAARGLVVDKKEYGIFKSSLNSVISQINILNDAIPGILEGMSFYKSAGNTEKKTSLVDVSYLPEDKNKVKVVINKKDQEKFLNNLAVSNQNLKKIKDKTETNILAANPLNDLANKLFRGVADGLVKKGYFEFLKADLKKITSQFILNSYIAMMLFSTLLSLVIAALFGVGSYFIFGELVVSLIVFLGIPIISLMVFLTYPVSTRKSLEKKIDQELPFLTIYLAAISTSGIEPSKIFSIIVKSKDYPTIKREIKKLTNYINFYGHDLVSALRIVSRNNPSDRLSQLFDGLATTITSGGELTEFFNKHAESLLFDYRLEREKYTRVTETMMNIYISIVIAAPMIMMVLFILMGMTGFGGGLLQPENIGFLSVGAIVFLNLIFLLYLNSKQPNF